MQRQEPTPIRRRSSSPRGPKPLVVLQGTAAELAEHGQEISERMQTRAELDRRSDAYALRAARRMLAVARGGLSAEEAAAECRLAALDLLESQRLDALEDSHCEITADLGVSVEHGGRQIVSTIHAQLGGRS